MPEKKNKKRYEFEYCVVCKLNHDQGPSHKYIPSHTKSLSTFLSRFQDKLTDVRFFLKNPTPLRPELASRNRLWCVFCDTDINKLDSSFACSNAINHLASADHLKNLKHFLWKYGGGMDRLDTFRISEDDLAMWEKKCKSLKSEAVPCREKSRGPTFGPSNDIHNELKYGIIDTFENNSNSSFSNGVMPLLYHTNEHQVSHSGPPQVTNVGCFPQDVATSSLHGETSSVSSSTQHSFISNGRKCSADGYFSNERMSEVYQHERMTKGQSSSPGFQNLTQISSTGSKEASGNVHSGAPPPWLEGDEEIQFTVPLKPASECGNLVAEKSPEKNLSWRNKNYLRRLKVNLRCQLRYSLTSANGCEQMRVNDCAMMVMQVDDSSDDRHGRDQIELEL
ncbi:TITAN-like protein isoform X3 [Prunus yedoensis var. nudiflora]|uniref:TITAN-like protein isoform X3 n=1 Tax=Prunus yedoensis var. nudiflora TaxID=2094558 RepID=A0A314ZIN5_PRUYE|nr:TITAN-like protein isoform X3 [Prunus yedoensis var. nudiflora]